MRRQIRKVSRFCGVEILTFCLIRFRPAAPPAGPRQGLWTPTERFSAKPGDISQFMKEFKQRFTIWYNRSRPKRRSGTLWGERFKSVLVQDEAFALATVAAYIDLNPVRAP